MSAADIKLEQGREYYYREEGKTWRSAMKKCLHDIVARILPLTQLSGMP